MAVLEIPIQLANKKFRQTTVLDGVSYIFSFSYNTRFLKWIMDIFNEDNEIVLSGIPLYSDRVLLNNYKHLAIPQGDLFCIDTEALNEDPNKNEFGTRFKLIYVEPE
jgi:hypothetical protein